MIDIILDSNTTQDEEEEVSRPSDIRMCAVYVSFLQKVKMLALLFG